MKTTSATSPAKSLKIIERKKIWLLIPVAVMLVAAIMVTIFAFAANSPVNMSVDFVGGYYITVRSSNITEDNYTDYVKDISQLAKNLTDEDGDCYGLRIAGGRRYGESTNLSVYITYQRIKGFSDDEMTEVGEALEQGIVDLMTLITPSVSKDGGAMTIKYDRTMAAFATDIETSLRAQFPGATLQWVNPAPAIGEQSNSQEPYATELTFVNAVALGADEAAVREAATINDEFSATVSEPETVSGRISPDLINYTIAAALIALVVAFAYFSIRFRKLSIGFVVALSMFVDVAMALFFAFIFHIEITALFMGLIATVFVFSAYNKAIVFDKMKENMRNHRYEITPSELVEISSLEILKRAIYMLVITSAIVVVLSIACAIIGVIDAALLALPLIFGLVSASFTTLFFAPALWATINKSLAKPKEKNKSKKKEPVTI